MDVARGLRFADLCSRSSKEAARPQAVGNERGVPSAAIPKRRGKRGLWEEGS